MDDLVVKKKKKKKEPTKKKEGREKEKVFLWLEEAKLYFSNSFVIIKKCREGQHVAFILYREPLRIHGFYCFLDLCTKRMNCSITET